MRTMRANLTETERLTLLLLREARDRGFEPLQDTVIQEAVRRLSLYLSEPPSFYPYPLIFSGELADILDELAAQSLIESVHRGRRSRISCTAFRLTNEGNDRLNEGCADAPDGVPVSELREELLRSVKIVWS